VELWGKLLRLLFFHWLSTEFYLCVSAQNMGGSKREEVFAEKTLKLSAARDLTKSLAASPNELRKHDLNINLDGIRRSAFDLLRYKEIDFTHVSQIWPELNSIEDKIKEQIAIEAAYSGYIERQESDIKSFYRDEDLRLAEDLDYSKVSGFSAEMVQKFTQIKPRTIGAASRISGVTPAAIVNLLRFVKKAKNQKNSNDAESLIA
jgi:tRNA uridine 5-carboxymethylaminomethyl modification enzyme